MGRHLATTAAIGLLLVAPHAVSDAADGTTRWYRGNTHTHPHRTPLSWYRHHGYDFVVLTDDDWVDTAAVNMRYGTPGRFIVIAGQEIRTHISDPDHPKGFRFAHVNAIGSRRQVADGDYRSRPGVHMPEALTQTLAAIEAAGAIAIIDHPNYGPVLPTDLHQVPDGTFFELWNSAGDRGNTGNGALGRGEFENGNNNLAGKDGDGVTVISTEALWDRLLSRGKLIYGIASDDGVEGRTGRGAVMVQAEAFTPEKIMEALRAGRFYSTTGVTFERYDRSLQEIAIAIDREHGTSYRIQFIGQEGRQITETQGTMVRYRPRGDEGYIRVKVSDSRGRQAWTQPLFLRQSK